MVPFPPEKLGSGQDETMGQKYSHSILRIEMATHCEDMRGESATKSAMWGVRDEA